MNTTASQFHIFPGAVHIHTTFSDGTGNIDQITKAAKKAGLKWVIITDHNNTDIEEGFYNGICVIKGEEISPETSDHYIALGIKNTIIPDKGIKNYVQEARNQGGFGYAAHPDESDTRKNNANPIRWTDKSVIPDGIEIWNWFSDWADNYDSSNIFKIAYAYFFKHKIIKGPHAETLKWWDDLSKVYPCILAIGGVDAHALKISKYLIPVTIFPYKDMFNTIVNYFILEEPVPESFEEQKNFILNLLKRGKNIIINRAVKNIYPLIYKNDNYLTVKLFCHAEIRIIHNGDIIFQKRTDNLSYELEPDKKYRIEIYLNNTSWLYTNFISL